MKAPLPVLLLAATALTACARANLPEIAYDDRVPALAPPPALAVEQPPRPVHMPPAWTPARGGDPGPVTVWCRSFDHVMCSKGDEPWAQAGRMNFARMRCVSR